MQLTLKFGLALALTAGAVTLFPNNAQAQESAGYCCMKTSGATTPMSKEVCEATPGGSHLLYSANTDSAVKAEGTCIRLAQANATSLEAIQGALRQLRAAGQPIPDNMLEMEQGLLGNTAINPGGVRPSVTANQTVGDDDNDDVDPPVTPDPNPPGLPPGIDLSTITGMQGVNENTLPQCCNIESGMFLGQMEAAVCIGEGGVPDTSENLEATEVCRTSGPGGSGGDGGGASFASPGSNGGVDNAWEIEDFEENMGNASMERWRDGNTPQDFSMPFNVSREMFTETNIEFDTVFRDSDAHTGGYSLRLKNYDMSPHAPPEVLPALIQTLGGRPPTAPAGVASCDSSCPSGGGSTSMHETLNVPDVGTHFCFAYKGYLAPGNLLQMHVIGDGGKAYAIEDFSRSAADWQEIGMQLRSAADNLPKSGKFGISAKIAGPAHPDPSSEVKIDSGHMCNPVGMTAFHPKVLADGRYVKIKDDEEETIGVQTFVNLDNDDEDGFFDNDENEDGVEDDDELVLLRMFAPENTRGKAALRAPDGLGTKYRLWAKEDKSEAFEKANQEPVDIKTFLKPGTKAGVIERRIWVEALEPSSSAGDMAFEFVFLNAGEDEKERVDKIIMTALQIDKIEFEGKGNGVDRKRANELDEDPNWPSGFSGTKAMRVFPGKSWDAPGGEPNSKVDVKVTLNVKPTREVPVYFKSFDVDDPTADDDDVDKEDKADDNRGETPARIGRFPDGKEIYKFPMSQMLDSFEFEVTMQPGDNFRIAGTGDDDALDALENDDEKLAASNPRSMARLVDKNVFEETDDATKSQHRRGKQRVSDVLTVWRKLHLEIDSMSNVQNNEYESEIVSFKNLGVDSATGARVTEITLNTTIYALLPNDSKLNAAGIEGAFLNGSANIHPWPTSNPYSIIDNSGNSAGADTLTLKYSVAWGDMSDDFIGRKIIFRDDDPQRDGDPVPPLDTSRIVDAFAPAYVLPTWDEIENSSKMVPFRLNSKSDKPEDLRTYYAFENKGYEADPQLWTVYVLNAFQGILTEDADGKGEGGIAGEADNTLANTNDGQGVHIYEESGRELIAGRRGAGWTMADILPHEIGHLFTGDHAEEGLMWDSQDPRNAGQADRRTADFGPKSLDTIRSQEHP